MNHKYSSLINRNPHSDQTLTSSNNNSDLDTLGGKISINCHSCDGELVYPEGLNGEKICAKCGLVIDETPSFKSFSHWTPEWHSNWNEQDSETLKEWLTTLRAVSCQLNIPNFPYREEAARTLRKQTHCFSKSQKLSKNKRATVAALIHLVLKEYDKVRPIKDISQELVLDKKLVLKQTWILKKTLDPEKKVIIQRKTPKDYLFEKGRKVTFNEEIISSAEKTLLFIKGSGGNPIGVAAGALYFVCKKKTKISKNIIGQAFGISERTVYANEVRIRGLIQSKTRVIPQLMNL
jgi:transcription initiation factor TFIIIB Brf1 subunit/transcription initiation factor TFIIB